MTTVTECFDKIAKGIAAKGETALEIAEIYQFTITGEQAGAWTINCKVGPSCAQGAAEDATCILTISDEDFVALINGEKNGMELFATGKLMVERDIMAAMKLEKLLTM
jgi:putative sterol carrier protein